MIKICLITHCEASHSVDGKVGGWFNSELTAKGERQAAELPERLEKLGFNIRDKTVYSSDLKRASRTAQILTKNTIVEPILDQRLREMSFGTHEGLSQSEHNKTMTPLSLTDDRLEHRICDGAENRRIVATRISEFLNEIMKLEKDIIIVTHGFAATFVIAAFQKIDVSSMGYVNYKLTPGSISILEEDNLFQNRTVSLLNG